MGRENEMTILVADDTSNPLDIEAASHLLTKTAADILERHYPGWGWMVGLDLQGGVMDVRCARLPGPYGFRLKLSGIDYEGRSIMRAGGEFLERYRMRRGAYRPGATFVIERDFLNNPVPDHD
jgi:hypothetical protein